MAFVVNADHVREASSMARPVASAACRWRRSVAAAAEAAGDGVRRHKAAAHVQLVLFAARSGAMVHTVCGQRRPRWLCVRLYARSCCRWTKVASPN